ncbi:MAG: hypothetical protein COA79_12860 [Planctomycetota bacterium]|nr:MAG: hypothetical protein COA79_12860 [Planctomycetota bacterium]
MTDTQFHEARESARLPQQRSIEEDNILGMLAVMSGYIDSKSPAFMDAIATNRQMSILDRFIHKNLLEPYQAQAIQLALDESEFKDAEMFGEVFIKLYGSDKKAILEKAYEMQKKAADGEREYIGQILLRCGHANVNQIMDVLKHQEIERNEFNSDLLTQIKILEKHFKPPFIKLFKEKNPELFWVSISFSIVIASLILFSVFI